MLFALYVRETYIVDIDSVYRKGIMTHSCKTCGAFLKRFNVAIMWWNRPPPSYTEKHNIRSFLFKIYFEISAGNFIRNKSVHCHEVITVRFTLITLNSWNDNLQLTCDTHTFHISYTKSWHVLTFLLLNQRCAIASCDTSSPYQRTRKCVWYTETELHECSWMLQTDW